MPDIKDLLKKQVENTRKVQEAARNEKKPEMEVKKDADK